MTAYFEVALLKFSDLQSTEYSDSKTGNTIRVSTTARLRFKEILPQYDGESILRTNDRIGRLFVLSSDSVVHYFRLKGAASDNEYIEVREGPAGDFIFISAVRNGNIDILTLQDNWKALKNGKGRDKPPGVKVSIMNKKDIIKKANIQAIWPQIYNMLKTPPNGVNLGNFPSKLPSIDKFIVDNISPDANAIGFVTTEDVDSDGSLDTIHISSESFMRELERNGISRNDLAKLNQLPPERLAGLLSAFVEVISHEMGHINDYSHGNTNPFPGGEGVADNAGRQAVQQVSIATNKNYFNNNRSIKMSALHILAELANDLDSLNENKAADLITDIMTKEAAKKSASVKKAQMTEPNLDGRVPTGRPPIEPIKTDPPIGFPTDRASAKPYEPSAGRTVGKLGPIRPVGDPYSYEYIPSEQAFVVKSFTYGPDQDRNARAERAIGAKITRKNVSAWSILSDYMPDESKSPMEGRPLVLSPINDPQRDFSEAQIQFAGWVRSGTFGSEAKKLIERDPSGQKLMSGTLSADRMGFMSRRLKELVSGGRVENSGVFYAYVEELEGWAAPLMQSEAPLMQSEDVQMGLPVSGDIYSDQAMMADDFALASDDTVDSIRKKAADNVRKLESLFSLPNSRGPFGRD
jgi:hypothetical protein